MASSLSSSTSSSALQRLAALKAKEVSITSGGEGTLKYVVCDERSGEDDSQQAAEPKATSKVVALCIPGIGDLREQYRFLAPMLQEAGISKVIVADLRGTGESTVDGLTSFTPEDVAMDMKAIMENEQSLPGSGEDIKVVLLVNSFAAAAAVFLAAKHPELVSAIVALGGFFRDSPKDPWMRFLAPLLLNRLWGRAAWISYYKTLYTRRPLPLDLESEYIPKLRAVMDGQHIDALLQFARASKTPSWALIGQVRCPVLLVIGSSDPDFAQPRDEMESVKSALLASSQVEVLEVEKAGHYPHVEAADEVAENAVTFLRAVGILRSQS